MKQIGERFEIKNNDYGPPKLYLGAEVEKFNIPNSPISAWSMYSKKYFESVVGTIRDLLAKDGRELKGGKQNHAGPLPPGYALELDTSEECSEEHASRYRQIFGIFCWAIELGQIDIITEVSMLS